MQFGPRFQNKITSFHSRLDEEHSCYALTILFNYADDGFNFLDFCIKNEIIAEKLMDSRQTLNLVYLLIAQELPNEFIEQFKSICQTYDFQFKKELLDPEYLDIDLFENCLTLIPQMNINSSHNLSDSDSDNNVEFTASDSEVYNFEEENLPCTNRLRTRSFP